jgi:hypothetical protein
VTLSRTQKLGFAFFLCTLLPAYWIANWRYESKLVLISTLSEREQSLHHSTDKLLSNCKKISAGDVASYEATDLICKQGQETHEHTSQAIEKLANEKESMKILFLLNFLSFMMALNLAGLLIYQGNQYLKSEQP